MRKLLTFLMIVLALALFAEKISLETPMGAFKLNVEESTEGKVLKTKTALVSDEIAMRMDTLEKSYCSKLNGMDKRKASKLMNEIYDLLALIPDHVKVMQTANYEEPELTTSSSSSSVESSININVNVNDDMGFDNEQPQENALPVIVPKKKAMSESEFNKFKQNVENESFGDDMLSVVRIGAKSKYFTTNQVVRLIELFSFSDEKIETVQICWPKVVDQDNAHNLIGAFTFSSDKEKVENIINQ